MNQTLFETSYFYQFVAYSDHSSSTEVQVLIYLQTGNSCVGVSEVQSILLFKKSFFLELAIVL